MPKEGPLAAVTTFSMAMERYEVPDLNGAALKHGRNWQESLA
jgi:hypothetical protein